MAQLCYNLPMAAKQTNRAKPAFTHFPKLTTGNDCNGAPIMLGDRPGSSARLLAPIPTRC